MTVVVGRVADNFGLASVAYLEQGPHRPELRHRCFALPAHQYRHWQPRWIPVDLHHDPDRTLGRVTYLERDAAGLWAIATVDRLPIDLLECCYFSASTEGRSDIILRSLAFTDTPAASAARPVHFVPGDLRAAEQHARAWRDIGIAERLARAIAYQRRHDPQFEHTITDLRVHEKPDEWSGPTVTGRPAVEWSKPPAFGRERRTTRKPYVVTPHRQRTVRGDDGIIGPLEYGPPGRVVDVR